jgi:transposase
MTMFPVCLDEYVSKDHICRVIDAFTRQLDMYALGFKYAICKETGRPPYDPCMMLSLYIYGYLHRVRSSRRLHAETLRNVEVMWLLDGLTPDDKTICNFRTDNKKALKDAFRCFSIMCRTLGLYGGETTATDSTKFRANNSRKNNHNRTTVEKELSRLDKKINEYMAALEQGDKEESGEKAPDAQAIKAALEHLNQRKIKYENLLERVEAEGEVSTVDPESRLMHSGGDARKLDICYNVHTVVDSKHKLIVDFEVSNKSNDFGNLHVMTEKTKEVLEVQTLTNLADKGYYDGEDIAACEASGVACLVPKPKPGGAVKKEGFSRERFYYDRENDCYNCPGQNPLRYMREQKHSNGKVYRVYANYPACRKCCKKTDCTKGEHREILRPLYQDVLDVVDERTVKNKPLYSKRQEIVEHPFGTIKSVWGYKQYLCRGKSKVTAETALAYLAYNMRRVINIFLEKGESLTTAMSAVVG